MTLIDFWDVATGIGMMFGIAFVIIFGFLALVALLICVIKALEKVGLYD
jgi:hypothetical protein